MGKTGAETGSVRQDQGKRTRMTKDSRLCLVGKRKPFNVHLGCLSDQEIQGKNLHVELRSRLGGPPRCEWKLSFSDELFWILTLVFPLLTQGLP